jgi:hypothetical protein
VTDGPNAGQRRRGRKLLGTRLFVISYVPLWLIFAVRAEETIVIATFAFVAGVGLVDALLIVSAGLQRSMRRVAFDEVSDKSGDAAGYLATYLLPFIGGPPTDVKGAVAYIIYFGVAWTVFVPSNLGLINPTLYLFGWRVFEATRHGQRILVISQDPPTAGDDGLPSAALAGQIGWVQRPSRAPWTWISQRNR